MNIHATYDDQGYLFPLQAMSGAQADQYRSKLERLEHVHGVNNVPTRGYGNIAVDFIDEITRLDSILGPVSEILGPDLLVWGANLFIKEPSTPHFVSWHQDLTYWGLDNTNEVTAWVALTPATTENGCMRFMPGSHRQTIVEHRDTFSDDNLLSRGQELAVAVDEEEAVDVVLAPGEFSLHHGRIFHASNPNRSNQRRIGLAIRYISPDMSQVGSQPTVVRLVKGEDKFGHFELAPPPSGVLEDTDVERMVRAEQLQGTYAYQDATQPGRAHRDLP